MEALAKLYHRKKTEILGQESKVLSELKEASSSSVEALMAQWEATDLGLEEASVEFKRGRYGYNDVNTLKPPSWIHQLLKCIANPFNVLLFVLAGISYLTRDLESMSLMIIMAVMGILISFFQEFRSEREAEKLKAMVQTTTTVRRRMGDNGESIFLDIPIKQVVPGDIVRLSAGDMVPADLRLIYSRDLFINQSVLTGEALPVEKSETYLPSESSALSQPNLCFMGSNVISGTAQGLVVATGKRTYLGALTRSLDVPPPPSSFELGIKSISWLIVRFVFVMTIIVFFIIGIDKGNWVSALMFAVAVGVGLTPEMLPMIVTANLAKGAIVLSRHKVIVKHLNAIQNFGAMDVLCTDKTGTLTLDKIVLQHHFDIYGREDLSVLKYAYLNSIHQTGLKNLLDVAVIEEAERHDPEFLQETAQFNKVDEFPFDFQRRRMSVVVEDQHKEPILICKGAVDEVASICREVEDHQKIMPLTKALLDNIQKLADTLNEEGFRVLLLAYRKLDRKETTYSKADEEGLILKGLLAFLDPPKESAFQAVPALIKNGVSVKVITGDNAAVTRHICTQVGLNPEPILLGPDIEKMSLAELQEKVDETMVFAKVSPLQKTQIIRALKGNGHVVGFLGDGVNDASALREADVGITVDTGVDIAKESADIILLEKSLMVLDEGIIEGRLTFFNIVKYIKMALSSNFGNVLTIVGASIILPFLPILPVQLLFQNLLADISQTGIPMDRVDKESIEKPRNWSASEIGRFMLFLGPVSSIFDYVTFGILWFWFGANNTLMAPFFHTAWFIEGLITQILIIYVIRTERLNFFESKPAMWLLLTTGLMIGIGIWLPFSPFSYHFHFVALPTEYFAWLGLILVLYFSLTTFIKAWYLRRFRVWI